MAIIRTCISPTVSKEGTRCDVSIRGTNCKKNFHGMLLQGQLESKGLGIVTKNQGQMAGPEERFYALHNVA